MALGFTVFAGTMLTVSSNVTLFRFTWEFLTEDPLEVVMTELLPILIFSPPSLPFLGVGGNRALPMLEFPMELAGLSSLMFGLGNKS